MRSIIDLVLTGPSPQVRAVSYSPGGNRCTIFTYINSWVLKQDDGQSAVLTAVQLVDKG